MRGRDERSEGLFSYVRLEEHIPTDHPLRAIRRLCDEALGCLDARFEALYSGMGRPSTPPEMLLRATLLQAFFSVRSERLLMEQIDYNLLFRWFVGLPMDAPVWHATVFTHNRDRLLEADVAREFLGALMGLGQVRKLLSSDHFSVDDTLVDAWASMKSFRPRDGSGEPPGPGRNGERDFRKEKRSNQTHVSTTDPDARLHRKADGHPSRLCYMGHVLMENRNGLAVDATLTHATGTAEREAALSMLTGAPRSPRITLGADKAYDVTEFVGDLRQRQVNPHITVQGTVSSTGTVRKTAIDGRTTRHAGYTVSQRIRKRIEEIFGWVKKPGGLTKTKLRGRSKVEAVFTFAIIACSLVRIPRLLGCVRQVQQKGRP
ncbi:MAG: IS5 family transposase [Mesorhizobium sp.]|uniref:IS5 family transposase n=1 Tax=Mesorhizobium sp. TaxID=1871066 RepID=UPI000FE660D0|nr:IS5 family transposase [Mesorhizobium sp.]RWL96214.1 MAG: IS5 family transposase [Mesorhizobium sp.]TIO50355.1 MAG: IS5 family transposase [Mesorhizobium sp.]TIO56021.1 MAG: IS5 family transposase [Mesorhizobium sp.]TJV65454.1 MAG: IS5 family transposase [Mesorhizobium sp.]